MFSTIAKGLFKARWAVLYASTFGAMAWIFIMGQKDGFARGYIQGYRKGFYRGISAATIARVNDVLIPATDVEGWVN